MFEIKPENTVEIDPREAAMRIVIEALSKIHEEDGDPSICEELQAYNRELEREADEKVKGANPEIRSRVPFEMAIHLARVYAQAGYLEYALESLDSLREGVGSGGHDDLLQEIYELMGKIEDRMNAENPPQE